MLLSASTRCVPLSLGGSIRAKVLLTLAKGSAGKLHCRYKKGSHQVTLSAFVALFFRAKRFDDGFIALKIGAIH